MRQRDIPLETQLIYLFVRTDENRWDLVDQTEHAGPDDGFVRRVQEHEQLATVPWVMSICLEPGAIELSELMSYWGMSPGSDPLPDNYMHGFVRLAKEKSPPGGGRWITPASGTAILAENRLETVDWPEPAFMRLLPKSLHSPKPRTSRKPWWKFW